MQDGTELQRLFRPLKNNWPWIAAFVLSAMTTALALTYVYSERYETSALLIFRAKAAPDASPALPQAFGSPVPAASLRVVGQTLLELARSPDLMRSLVEEFDLDSESSKLYAPGLAGLVGRLKDTLRDGLGDLMALAKFGRVPAVDPTIQAMQKLASNINVRSYDAYVFRVEVEDVSPIRAAAIANRVARALVAQSRDEDRRPGEMEREQLKLLLAEKEAAMVDARMALRDVLAEGDAASAELETQQLLERRTQLKLERSRLNADIQKARQRLKALSAKAALKSRTTSSGEIRAPVGSAAISPEDFKRLESQQLYAQVEVSALEAEYAALDASVAEIDKRIRSMPNLQSRVDALRLSVRLLERDLEMLSDAYQGAVIRATGLSSEIAFHAPALVPSEPKSPIKLYHVGLTGFLAVVVALGVTYVLAFLADQKRLSFPLADPGELTPSIRQSQLVARSGAEDDDRID